jgi:hypothetical protein
MYRLPQRKGEILYGKDSSHLWLQSLFLIAGTLPQPRRPVQPTIDRHGLAHGRFTREWLVVLLAQQTVDAKAPGPRIGVLQV